MSIVNVDSRRRIYIPKKIPFKAEKVIILPHGSSFLLIPIPEKIVEIDVDASIEKLKGRAEEKLAHGSIDSLLNRLEIVEPKSSKLIIVATHSEFQRQSCSHFT